MRVPNAPLQEFKEFNVTAPDMGIFLERSCPQGCVHGCFLPKNAKKGDNHSPKIVTSKENK